MKLTYLLIALGLLVAVAYARPVEEDEPMEGKYYRISFSFSMRNSLLYAFTKSVRITKSNTLTRPALDATASGVLNCEELFLI